MSLAFAGLRQHLACKLLLIDTRALIRHHLEPQAIRKDIDPWGRDAAMLLRDPASLLAGGNVKKMLQSEIREALGERKLSVVGKRWELEARLADAIREEEATSTSAAPPERKSWLDATFPLQSFSDGTEVLSDEAAHGARDGGDGGNPHGDGAPNANPSMELPATKQQMLNKYAAKLAAKRSVITPAAVDTLSGGGARWAMRAGARELLQYVDMRGMTRGLLLADDIEESADAASGNAAMTQNAAKGGHAERGHAEGDGAERDAERAAAAAEARANTLVESLQVPAFDLVLPAEASAALRSGDPSGLQALTARLQLPPKEAMLVTCDTQALAAARRANWLACYFDRKLPGGAGRVPADFWVGDMKGLRFGIEDLNGITYREQSTHIRTRFGV